MPRWPRSDCFTLALALSVRLGPYCSRGKLPAQVLFSTPRCRVCEHDLFPRPVVVPFDLGTLLLTVCLAPLPLSHMHTTHMCVLLSCFFHPSPTSPGLAGVIVMSIWAHQENTHEHNLSGFGKVYFKYGNAFSSCIFAWVFCLGAIACRFVLIDRFGSASQANFAPSSSEDTPYMSASTPDSSPYHGPSSGGL